MSDVPEASDGSPDARRDIPADLLADFVDEGAALLADIRTALDGIAATGPTSENVNAAFRSMHTLKGTSGMLGLTAIGGLAHAAEDVLHAVRGGSVDPGPELLALLRQAVDKLGESLTDVTTGGSDARASDPALVEQLLQALSAVPEADAAAQHSAVEAVPEQIPRVGQVLIDSGAVTLDAVLAAVERQRAGDTRRIGEILIGDGLVTQEQVLSALGHQAGVAMSAAQSRDSSAAVRVPARILADLADLTTNLLEDLGELALDDPFPAPPEDADGLELDPAGAAALEAVATRHRLWEQACELAAQAGAEVVQVRTVRASALWSAASTAVADVTALTGKQARLVTHNGDLVIDRLVAQVLRDPLVHLVRNSVDHGIEAPDERAAAGKDPRGSIDLTVRIDDGALYLEVADDGAGLDLDRIAGRALTNGHITIRQLSTMSSQEIIDLIFAPGFSTRDQVTTVSGRGVGLDVVRNNLASVGGQVVVETTPGAGTVFRLRVPLPD